MRGCWLPSTPHKGAYEGSIPSAAIMNNGPLLLDEEGYDWLIKALDNPREPNQKLLDAAKRYKDMSKYGTDCFFWKRMTL